MRNIFFIVGILFLVSSCDFVSKAYKETFEESQNSRKEVQANDYSGVDEETMVVELDMDSIEAPTEHINLLENAAELTAVQQQLQAMFPGKHLSVFPPHIYFENSRIRLQLVDPDIPENVDWYYYTTESGVWERQDPVKTSAHIKRTPVNLDALKFSTASKVYQKVIEKAAVIEGAENPTTVYFTFHVPIWNWNARIVGSRSDYNFKADKEGNEIEFKKQ